MSFKTRVGIPIVLLAAAVVLALSLLHLHSLAEAEYGHTLHEARTAAVQVQNLVTNRVNQQTALLAPEPSRVVDLWLDIAARDPIIQQGMRDTLAAYHSLVEIALLSPNGKTLTSTNAARVGLDMPRMPTFEDWPRLSFVERMRDLFLSARDYQVSLPLGYEGQTVLLIQVIESSRLLGDSLEKLFYPLGIVSLIALSIALLLALFVANLALRPIAGISEALDRISRGERAAETAVKEPETAEVKALQTKLNLLGQQFRGAREDADGLRKNVERLLDRLQQAVLLFDHEHRLVMAGGDAERLLGAGRWLLAGQSVFTIFAAGTPLGDAVQLAVQSRSPLRDFLTHAPAGAPHTGRIAVNVEPLESVAGRDYLGALVTLRDAETRSQLETQLEVSTRLAAINRLTGGVAHEIKNPLNAITLHLEVLREKLRHDWDRVGEEMDVITREVQRLDRVVKTFLDFTRPLELHWAAVDLGQLLEETAALAASQAKAAGQGTRIDIPQDSLVIRADRDLLKQALLNIAINGSEAMQEGGLLSFALARQGDSAVVEISDQGPGIPPEIQPKIFNLYFTTKKQGSGIGLAMTFRVVQLHNATIDFTSTPESGTTFRLRFPLWMRQLDEEERLTGWPEPTRGSAANSLRATS